MKRLGILGGTFNPVHIEHVALARMAVNELNLDKLLVMPTFISPHKNTVPAPSEDRLNMLKLCFSNDEKIEVSDFEIEKQGKSYTYQTVEYFKDKENAELFFIVGADMLNDFKNWRYPERILSACNLAVFGRSDVCVDYEETAKYFKERFGKEFIRLNYVGGEFSSTKIRIYSSLGLPLDELTSKEVEEYIKSKNLYFGNIYTKYIKQVLPQKRIKHTADVMVCALKKAKELGLDEGKVLTACALHDCAKYMDYKKVKGFSLPENVPEPVVHAFLGAFIAERKLGVTDSEVLDAIRYHTSGKAQMTTLSKLVFVADMIEEGRDYQGVEILRELYEKSDFEECFRECIKEETVHLLNKKQNIFIETLNAYDYYIKKGN